MMKWLNTALRKMKTAKSETIPDNPKAALAAFITELQDAYYVKYEKSAQHCHAAWMIAQGTAVLAGIATTAVAALIKADSFKESSVPRILLIVIPSVGTLASTFLLQTRVRDLLALRERGWQAVQTLITQIRAEFAAAESAARFTEIHRDAAKRIEAIEKDQTAGFFSVVPEMTAPTTQQGGSNPPTPP